MKYGQFISAARARQVAREGGSSFSGSDVKTAVAAAARVLVDSDSTGYRVAVGGGPRGGRGRLLRASFGVCPMAGPFEPSRLVVYRFDPLEANAVQWGGDGFVEASAHARGWDGVDPEVPLGLEQRLRSLRTTANAVLSAWTDRPDWHDLLRRQDDSSSQEARQLRSFYFSERSGGPLGLVADSGGDPQGGGSLEAEYEERLRQMLDRTKVGLHVRLLSVGELACRGVVRDDRLVTPLGRAPLWNGRRPESGS